jgi:hypothetical protein
VYNIRKAGAKAPDLVRTQAHAPTHEEAP